MGGVQKRGNRNLRHIVVSIVAVVVLLHGTTEYLYFCHDSV